MLRKAKTSRKVDHKPNLSASTKRRRGGGTETNDLASEARSGPKISRHNVPSNQTASAKTSGANGDLLGLERIHV
jgi:hypothetical protein